MELVRLEGAGQLDPQESGFDNALAAREAETSGWVSPAILAFGTTPEHGNQQ
jgi:hypothetical protein